MVCRTCEQLRGEKKGEGGGVFVWFCFCLFLSHQIFLGYILSLSCDFLWADRNSEVKGKGGGVHCVICLILNDSGLPGKTAS